jgi:hypothetical protein
MPLWIIAKFLDLEKCGCALTSLGAPCVAHLVCPIPILLVTFFPSAKFSSSITFPCFLYKLSSPPSISATPELS